MKATRRRAEKLKDKGTPVGVASLSGPVPVSTSAAKWPPALRAGQPVRLPAAGTGENRQPARHKNRLSGGLSYRFS
jgi:hypothetical protein